MSGLAAYLLDSAHIVHGALHFVPPEDGGHVPAGLSRGRLVGLYAALLALSGACLATLPGTCVAVLDSDLAGGVCWRRH